MPTAAVPPLLRRGVFERDSSGEVLVLVVEEGARIFAREDAVGEVRREVGEEVDPGRDLRVGGFEFGFGVEDDARSDAVGLEEEEEGRRPEVPVRDAVGETDEGRERVACRGGCEVKGEGEGDPDFWTVPLTEGDLREVSGDERRGEEGFAFPEAGGPPPTGLWDGLLLLLLLLSLSVFGRGAREEADGSGERGRAGPIVAVIAVFVGGDGLRAAVAGGTSSSDASPAGSASDAEVGECSARASPRQVRPARAHPPHRPSKGRRRPLPRFHQQPRPCLLWQAVNRTTSLRPERVSLLPWVRLACLGMLRALTGVSSDLATVGVRRDLRCGDGPALRCSCC